MTVRPEVRVEGGRELRRALKNVADGTKQLKSVHADAAHVVELRAAVLVPKLTGTLGGSLRSSGTQRGGVVRAGRASVPWAGPIHFGWPSRGIAPQPFLYDALDERIDEVVDLYETRVKKLIRKNGL